MKLNLNANRKHQTDRDRPSPVDDPVGYRRHIKAGSLDGKVEELRQRRRAAVKELADADEALATPSGTSAAEIMRQAQTLLDGKLRPVASGISAADRLRQEIYVIDKALEIADQKRQQEMFERIGAELYRRQDEWNEIVLKEAMALAEARRQEKARQAFLASLTGHGPPAMPTANCNLASLVNPATPIETFLAECVRLGIVTKKEIQ